MEPEEGQHWLAGLGVEGRPAQDQAPNKDSYAESRELLYSSSSLAISGPAGGSTWQGERKGQLLTWHEVLQGWGSLGVEESKNK